MILALNRVNKIRNRFHFRIDLDLEHGNSSLDRQITKLKRFERVNFVDN